MVVGPGAVHSIILLPNRSAVGDLPPAYLARGFLRCRFAEIPSLPARRAPRQPPPRYVLMDGCASPLTSRPPHLARRSPPACLRSRLSADRAPGSHRRRAPPAALE